MLFQQHLVYPVLRFMHQNLQHFLMGKYRNMEQKKRNRNSRQIVRILKLIHFRMKWNQMQIQTDLWMKQQEYPQGKRMRMDLHINILKNLIHTA